jgi:membrane-bound metal-dependent hydrolase YbcI (DUF457 family)
VYPLTHFVTGMYLGYLSKKRDMLAFLIPGFLALTPDFDIVFNHIPALSFLGHRELFHSFLFAIIIGLLTWRFLGSFVMGFLAISSHIIWDVLDGTVRVMPLLPRVGVNICGLGNACLVLSSVIGVALVLGLIGIEIWRNKNELG